MWLSSNHCQTTNPTKNAPWTPEIARGSVASFAILFETRLGTFLPVVVICLCWLDRIAILVNFSIACGVWVVGVRLAIVCQVGIIPAGLCGSVGIVRVSPISVIVEGRWLLLIICIFVIGIVCIGAIVVVSTIIGTTVVRIIAEKIFVSVLIGVGIISIRQRMIIICLVFSCGSIRLPLMMMRVVTVVEWVLRSVLGRIKRILSLWSTVVIVVVAIVSRRVSVTASTVGIHDDGGEQLQHKELPLDKRQQTGLSR